MIPFCDPPRPGLQEELRALRAEQKVMASSAAMAHFIEARLCAVYGFDADIHVDYDAAPGSWRHVIREKNLVREGRKDVLPPKKLLDSWPAGFAFFLAPDVAQKIILRDSGEYGPKESL